MISRTNKTGGDLNYYPKKNPLLFKIYFSACLVKARLLLQKNMVSGASLTGRLPDGPVLEIISRLVMLRNIETDGFGFFIHAQTHHFIYYLKDYKTHRKRISGNADHG